MIVRFIDNGEIVNHRHLNFLFIYSVSLEPFFPKYSTSTFCYEPIPYTFALEIKLYTPSQGK